MNQPQTAAIGHGVRGFFHHLHATEMMVCEVAGELIMVAWDVHHMAAFANALQDFLHHIVVGLRPIPFAAQLPTIDDVAHQIQVIAGVGFEKGQQFFGLAPRGAQVQI